jgi:hypothetical protein
MPRRREMELHGGVTLQPAAILGLVGIEVVEDDVDGGVRVSSDDAVHELEKLNAPPRPHSPQKCSNAPSSTCTWPRRAAHGCSTGSPLAGNLGGGRRFRPRPV